MQRVAIVNAGEYGALRQERGDYNSFVETVERALKEAKRATDGRPAAEVSVVQNTADALKWVMGEGAIIYITRGMVHEAKKVAAEHLDVRVILFTGLLPKGEVLFVGKWWLNSREDIQNAVLRG